MFFPTKKLIVVSLIVITLFFSSVFFSKKLIIFLSNTYQKEICVDYFCIKKPKGWVVSLTKKNKQLYLFDLVPIPSIFIDDDLDTIYDGFILKKGLSKIIFSKYKNLNNPNDERLFPQYKLDNNESYYMMQNDFISNVIYPKNKFIFQCIGGDKQEDFFTQELIENIILNSTSSKSKKNYLSTVSSKTSNEKLFLVKSLKKYNDARTTIDYKNAYESFMKIPKNRVAQFMLGVMNEKGQGVKINYKNAFKYYNESAKQGYIHALHNLALMYYYGRGIVQDYSKAASLFRKPVYYGYPESEYGLAELYHYGKGLEVNYNKALLLYHKSSSHGNYMALNDLGIMYYLGQGVKSDKDKACQYWNKALKGGNESAQKNLIKYCQKIR